MQPSPEEQCLEAEAKVHVALEHSAEAHVKGDASGGKALGSALPCRICVSAGIAFYLLTLSWLLGHKM